MRSYNETSYQTLPRTGSGHRSRSQNHYYIQANQFERRYQNSLMNAYRLNTSRKCPPCCGAGEEQGYESNMTFKESERDNVYNNKSGNEVDSEYYKTSYFNNQKVAKSSSNENEQLIKNLQKSKQYMQQLIQKSNTNFRIYKQKTQQQIQSLQKLLQSKTQQIQQLTKQVNRLKKISLQTSPNNGMKMSYVKQDQGNLIQMQNKEKQQKELQRKLSRYLEENSYFRQDIQIKNKEIQQLKAKFKLKENNDLNAIKQLQKDIQNLKQEKHLLLQKNIWFQKITQDNKRQLQRQRESKQREKQKIKKIQAQIQSMRMKYLQAKSSSDKISSQYIAQYSSLQMQVKSTKELSKQKDIQTQRLTSKINCIQAELDFFKDKFTNLLMEIEREERQSASMYDHATILKEEGLKFYEATEIMRQSELIELESQPKSSKLYGFNILEGADHRLAESIKLNNRVGLGKDTVFQSLSPKHFNKESGLMTESNLQFVHRFPSLNMSISPIRTKD